MSATPDYIRARELNARDRRNLAAELAAAADVLEGLEAAGMLRTYPRAVRWLRDEAARVEGDRP